MSDLEIQGPRTRVADLRVRYQLTASDVALATGTDERTVRRWAAHVETRKSSADDLIRSLERTIKALRQAGVNERSVGNWLREPAEYLDDRSPLAALGEGDDEAVRHYVAVTTLGASVGRGGGNGASSARTKQLPRLNTA